MGYWSHRNIKATRKEHQCEGCGRTIESGSPAFYWAGDYEGDFYSCYYHSDCREAEKAWNVLNDCWGDDYQSLCTIGDEEPEDVIWLVKAFPAVAARIAERRK